MASIKKNIAANLAGKIWGAAIAIILIPQYIKYLGIESYGLIGFYGTLIGSVAILDLGLSTTLNRELAKYKFEDNAIKDIRDLTFSLECIYWLISAIICFAIITLSGFISVHWVKVEHLQPPVVKQAILLMGIVVAFQWPISLYSGGLMGLEKQVLNNVITIIMTTLRAAGVIIILKYFSATIEAFFLWQAAISLLYVLIMKISLWRALPSYDKKPVFSKQQIKNIWHFAAGMTGIAIITFFLAQLDKIVLSKILPLSQFGYYTIAVTIATSISLIISPISASFFPRLAKLISAGEEEELIILYHKACKLVASIVFPICFVLIFFMQDIILIWTHSAVTTANTYLMAQILLCGSILNSLMIMPYNLLIANGRTKFTIYQNTIAAIILVPLLFILTNLYGALGAASVWVIVNAGYVFISQPIMHQKILRKELRKWYWDDTILPMLPPLLVLIMIKLSFKFIFFTLQINLIIIFSIFFITMLVSILTTPSVKILLRQTIKRMYK